MRLFDRGAAQSLITSSRHTSSPIDSGIVHLAHLVRSIFAPY
jgi:hypothetical protein